MTFAGELGNGARNTGVDFDRGFGVWRWFWRCGKRGGFESVRRPGVRLGSTIMVKGGRLGARMMAGREI